MATKKSPAKAAEGSKPSSETAPSPAPEAKPRKKDKKPFDLNKLVDAMFTSLNPDAPSGSGKIRDNLIREYIQSQI